MNQRISPKERNLLKGAIRRVFSRSDLRRKIIDSVDLPEYTDPSRPRVRKWSQCPVCKLPSPKYKMVVDHIAPIVPVTTALEHMTWDEVIDRTWCEENNLQPICESCHDVKTSREREERKLNKKGRSNVKRKANKRASAPNRKRNIARGINKRAIRKLK